MEKRISYLNRTYDDFKSALIELSKKYYPDLTIDYSDASVASWLIDLNADASDALSYHIDRVFQETNLNSAQEANSLFNLARNNGFKVPGPKGAMAEVRFSCYLPLSSQGASTNSDEPDWSYAPIIKRGTKVAASTQSFELLYDVDFKDSFDENGVSDRTITPVFDSNGFVNKYRVTKLAVVVAGESRVYKQVISSKDIKPFMEILLPVDNAMNVESVLMKDGNSLQAYPSYGEFYMPDETSTTYTTTTRFFEVDSLIQQNRWGDETENTVPKAREIYGYVKGSDVIPTYSIVRGEWKPLMHKFMTEFTDNGYLKVIFGAGFDSRNAVSTSATDFSKYQMGKMINNDSLGVLPNPNTTIFVLYRCGGGKVSNVAKGAIKSISVLNVELKRATSTDDAVKISAVKNSITVESTTPSVSGKDMPTPDELRYMIKYNSGAQERCVTVKDYVNRVYQLPPRYGTPFRVGGAEMNNKIMLYLLGIDADGKLDAVLPTALINNIQEYLKNYRMINDFVEIKSGKIINLSFEVDAYIDKNYNKADVVTEIINVVKDYMDINKHQMGDDIFVGDIEKEISKVDGVINLIDLRVYNEVDGTNYSSTMTSQEILVEDECCDHGEGTATNNRYRLDLEASDGIIYSDGDTMLEIKYPDKSDIRVKIKER